MGWGREFRILIPVSLVGGCNLIGRAVVLGTEEFIRIISESLIGSSKRVSSKLKHWSTGTNSLILRYKIKSNKDRKSSLIGIGSSAVSRSSGLLRSSAIPFVLLKYWLPRLDYCCYQRNSHFLIESIYMF